MIASISVGIFDGIPILDLDYDEDSSAETDMNVVMNNGNSFIEVQGTAEHEPFTKNRLSDMVKKAGEAVADIIRYQKKVLNVKW